nr:hypothetical protein [Desulfobacterales bacterium]
MPLREITEHENFVFEAEERNLRTPPERWIQGCQRAESQGGEGWAGRGGGCSLELQARLLGPLEVTVDGVRVEGRRWRSRKAQSLFSYLLLHPQGVTGDKLMEMFWPDADPGWSRHRLHYTINYARAALGDCRGRKTGSRLLRYEKGAYFVNPQYCSWIDVEEFARLVQEAKGLDSEGQGTEVVQRCTSAVQLYRGDFMEGFYDRWCEEERDFYQLMYVKALKLAGDSLFKMGDYSTAIAWYAKLLAVDEFREDVHRAVIRCHAKMGNRKGVIVQYERLKRLLESELSVEPEPETVRLYKELIHNPKRLLSGFN